MDLKFTKDEQPNMENFNKRFGDIYNKEETLSPETKTLLGLGADDTPDEAFGKLSGLYQHWWRRRTRTVEIRLNDPTTLTLVNGLASSSTTKSTSYADAVTIDEDTFSVALAEPLSTVDISYSNCQTSAALLVGKYFGTTSIYFVPSTAEVTRDGNSSSGYYVYIQGQRVIPTEVVGEWEYLASPDKDAYPDSGIEDGYQYEYLGLPFNNARSGAKIAMGSYIGVGLTGRTNANSLTFPFEPKLVVVVSRASYYSGGCPWVRGQLEGKSYELSGSTKAVTLSWDGNTLSWWCTTLGQVYQLNVAGTTYYYIAIG